MYKLLVADDESIERKVLCKILKKYVGDICEIYDAKSGREAVDIFEKGGIQIAILDIEMPGMNGLEAARKMRAASEHCVIIFLTAFDEFSYAKQAITVRALDYLLKPYDEKELIMVIEEAMHLVDKNYRTGLSEAAELSSVIEVNEEKTENVRSSLIKEKIKNYIEEHYAEEISMQDIAHTMNYSDAYFCKLFKQYFKVNFTAYLADYRLEIAKKMLEEPMTNVKTVGSLCGYPDSNYFTRVFKRAVGLTPTEYRTKILGEKRDKKMLEFTKKCDIP